MNLYSFRNSTWNKALPIARSLLASIASGQALAHSRCSVWITIPHTMNSRWIRKTQPHWGDILWRQEWGVWTVMGWSSDIHLLYPWNQGLNRAEKKPGLQSQGRQGTQRHYSFAIWGLRLNSTEPHRPQLSTVYRREWNLNMIECNHKTPLTAAAWLCFLVQGWKANSCWK